MRSRTRRAVVSGAALAALLVLAPAATTAQTAGAAPAPVVSVAGAAPVSTAPVAAAAVGAQAASAGAEPEDIGVVCVLTGPNAWKPLEMHRARFQNQNRALARDREMLTVPGLASPVRFKEGERPEFVVTVLLPMMLPTSFELFPLDIGRRDDRREVILEDQGFTTSRGSVGIHLRVQRFGPNSFKLIPSSPLPPGEYAFKYGLTRYASKDLYCFAVDPATPAIQPGSAAGATTTAAPR